MKRSVWVAVLLLAGATQGVSARHDEHSDASQQLGRRLYETSCGVCHTRPTLISRMYGPELSKTTAGGNQGVIRGVITDGTPRMPGFKYTYTPDQIAAIAAYIVTLQPGHQGPDFK